MKVVGEMKYFDTFLTATAIPATTDWTGTEFDPATFLTLVVPVVGAGVNQRIGKAIKVLKIKVRGAIQSTSQMDQTAGDPAAQVRLILHQDKQTNAAQAQGENVMSTPSANALVTTNGFQNIDNFGRFQVLADRTIVLENPNISWDGTNLEQQGLITPFKINHTFKKPVVMRFNATNGGTIADIVDNSFHIIATASNAGLTPTIGYSCRVCYKE